MTNRKTDKIEERIGSKQDYWGKVGIDCYLEYDGKDQKEWDKQYEEAYNKRMRQKGTNIKVARNRRVQTVRFV